MSEDQSLLEEAAKKLEEYARRTGCDWCKGSAGSLAQGARDLRELQRIGEEFVRKSQDTNIKNAVGEAEKLRRMREEAEGDSNPEEERTLRLIPTPAEALRMLTPSQIINFANLFPTPRDLFLTAMGRRPRGEE